MIATLLESLHGLNGRDVLLIAGLHALSFAAGIILGRALRAARRRPRGLYIDPRRSFRP